MVSYEIPDRLSPDREERLRLLLTFDFNLGTPSAKSFDIEEMKTLHGDLSAMLGEIAHLRTDLAGALQTLSSIESAYNTLHGDYNALADRNAKAEELHDKLAALPSYAPTVTTSGTNNMLRVEMRRAAVHERDYVLRDTMLAVARAITISITNENACSTPAEVTR